MISVIMPVKNGAKTIEVALQSILNQTFQDFEVLIIDDNSDDNTSDIIKRIANTNDKIKIIHNQKSLGVAASLNLALQQAKYEFIARMDADDESLPNRLQLQFDYLNKNPNICVVSGQVLLMGKTTDDDYILKYDTDPAILKNKMLYQNVISHPAVMYRKSVITQIGGYREFFKNAEDYDLWLRVLQHGYEIGNVDQILIRYNLSIGGATIGNQWVQYIYHRMAQHLYYHGDDSWNETLYHQIESKYIHTRSQYIIATYAVTLNWLLKTKQFKKAWMIFNLIPNKLSFYALKKIAVSFCCGLLKIEKGSCLKEFYQSYI